MHALAPLLLVPLLQDPAPTAKASPPPQPETSIWDRLSFYANGRVRGEATFDQPNGEDRSRGRLRLRIGGKYEVMENLTAEARLTTTSGDANNPYWDFGSGEEGFNGSEVALDRIFLTWRAREDLSVQVGQFPHVFADPPVYGEYVWDDDVHPAGAAAMWGPGKRDSVGYDVRGAGYVAVEDSGGSDSTMIGGQGNLYLEAGERTELQLASSLMSWHGLSGGAATLGNQGNTDVAGDFLIWDSFAAAAVEGGPMQRTTGFVQYMHNIEDDDGEDDGFALGLQLGKSGAKGDLSVFASYHDLDANAVFSPPAQDDTPIAGTGMDGIIAGCRYWISDNVSLRLWALTSDADAAEDPVRVRLDLDFTVR